VLGLIGNGLTDAAALAAAALLSSPGCPLARLYLNENLIGDAGAQALAEAVEAASARHRHRGAVEAAASRAVEGRAMEVERGAAEKRAVKKSADSSVAASSLPPPPKRCRGEEGRALDRLGLSDNGIGSAGGLALLSALSKGTTLEKLCASDNPFGPAVHSALARLPNVFVGAKPRRGVGVLDGATCRVVVVWKPPALHPVLLANGQCS
jgi:hypothetical protein